MPNLGRVFPLALSPRTRNKVGSPANGAKESDVESPPPSDAANNNPADSPPVRRRSLKRTQSFKVDDYTHGQMLYLHLTLFVTITPILFIWSQPLLTRWAPGHDMRHEGNDYFATPGLDPAEPGDVPIGYTLSSYISNAHSTGATALLFKGNSFMTWSEYGLKAFLENVARDDENDDRYLFAFLLLFAYELAFGLFLTFSTDYMPIAHLLAVTVFCISAICAYNYLYQIGSYYRDVHAHTQIGLHPMCGWLVALGTLAFVTTIMLVGLHVLFNINFYHFFWASECTGLTTVLLMGGVDRVAKFIEKKGWPHTKYILTFGLLGNRVGNDRVAHLMRRASRSLGAFGAGALAGHQGQRVPMYPSDGEESGSKKGDGAHRMRLAGLGGARQKSSGATVTFAADDGTSNRDGGGASGHHWDAHTLVQPTPATSRSLWPSQSLL